MPPTSVCNVRAARPGTYVYVGRPMPRSKHYTIKTGSPFGNPFKNGHPADVIEQYVAYLKRRPDLLALLPSLQGKRLGCWCVDWGGGPGPLPDTLCHAIVLALMADGEEV